VEQFDELGFVVVRGLVAPDELAQLREETAAQIEAGPDRAPQSDFLSRDGHFFRIQFLTDKALRNDSLLLAGAHPGILERVALILGEDWTTYGSAMVFKSVAGGPEIALHRDLGPGGRFSDAHRFFNVDIYLDEATPMSGCLRVLPGSHRAPDLGAGLADGLTQAGLVDVPMQPGDVLFHDSMLLHGSFATPPGSPLRRVLYYSYQSASWMLREGVLPGYVPDRSWIARSMKLMDHAIAARGDPRFAYRVPEDWRAEVDRAALELRPIAGNLPWEGAEEAPSTR
jgi:phytanoyl-CoA hydroxylase